jgi:hypothetical protein
MPPVYETLLLNTVVPQIQAAQAGDSYVMVVNATTPALRITQTGTGDALVVEDSANPDSTAFVLNASGNLGLGVTPSGWWSGRKAFQLGNTVASIAAATSGNALEIGFNRFLNSSVQETYVANGPASLYSQGAGMHLWFTAPSGTAGNAISFTQAMTLDASGNLGVGTTSPSVRLHAVLDGQNTILAASTSTAGVYQTIRNGTGRMDIGVANSAGTTFYAGGAPYSVNITVDGAYPLIFGTNGAERARITSGGDLLVGTNIALNGTARLDVNALTGNNVAATLKNDAGANQWTAQVWNAGTSGDNSFIQFATETAYTGRGSITYNRGGGLVAYNTTSDYRAKDILGPFADSGTTIDALKVYNGKMKGATVERPMLVAHEAQAVTPYAVTGDKDAVNDDGTPKYQQMDVSSLVPLLIAELQSIRARVVQLEAK